MKATKEQMKTLGRLLKRPAFLHVQQHGQKWVSKTLILQVAPNEMEISRFGLTVTKRVSKLAVFRNRIRRRLRALAYDVLTLHAKPGYDFVLIGRFDTHDCTPETLKKDLLWCLKRMDMLKS